MRGAAYTAHGDTYVDSGTETLVEEVGHKVNLTVGDRNHVCRDIGGNVAGLRFDNRQSGERAAALDVAFQACGQVVHGLRHLVLIIDFSGTLQKARVEIEYIAGISLAAGGAAKNKRHLTISDSLLGKVVVNYEGVHTAVTEEFADCGAGERSKVLQGSRLGGRGAYHDGVRHCAGFFERIHDARHGRCFLADGNVDAIYRVAVFVTGFLVDNGVDSNGRFTRLAVADNQLALSAADRYHRVDGFKTRLERLTHGLAVDNARCLAVERHQELFAGYGCAAVERLAERVDDAAEHIFIYLNGGNAACALHALAFLDTLGGSHEHYADVVFFQVHGNTHHAVFKLYEFVFRDIGQPVNAGNAVAYGKHYADFFKFYVARDVAQLLQQHFRNFAGFDFTGHNNNVCDKTRRRLSGEFSFHFL